MSNVNTDRLHKTLGCASYGIQPTFSEGMLALSRAAGTPSCAKASVWSSIRETRGDTTSVTPGMGQDTSENQFKLPQSPQSWRDSEVSLYDLHKCYCLCRSFATNRAGNLGKSSDFVGFGKETKATVTMSLVCSWSSDRTKSISTTRSFYSNKLMTKMKNIYMHLTNSANYWAPVAVDKSVTAAGSDLRLLQHIEPSKMFPRDFLSCMPKGDTNTV